ncbi:MAG TPA: response regulator transcription factor [Pyrinomonadaceae bacterium]|nr:response regulator transcription factor [Pyrinomonadaceae bacterium]
MPIKILIIENETLIRVGIRSVLLAEADFEIVGEATTSGEGFKLFQTRQPDVTLMSLRLKETCAIDDVKTYRDHSPNAKIIILAPRAGDGEISKALKQGALGYVLKDISPAELVKAIRIVATGKKYIPTDVAEVLTEHLGMEELTPSELIVLRMLVGAMTNKEIAFGLDVSENTVKTHIKNIFDKLGVSDRTAATTTAIRRGLVRMDV